MPDSEPEPLSAILAEFRKFALRAAEEDKMISPESVLLLADKAEAAVKREREAAQGARDMRDALEYAFAQKSPKFEQPGNAAAMREALKKVHKAFRDGLIGAHGIATDTEAEALFCLWHTEIPAALAAPARNCDKYSLDDIKKMDRDFGAFCKQFGAKNGENCSGCPIKPMDNLCCHSTWMLLPAAEGGAE